MVVRIPLGNVDAHEYTIDPIDVKIFELTLTQMSKTILKIIINCVRVI